MSCTSNVKKLCATMTPVARSFLCSASYLHDVNRLKVLSGFDSTDPLVTDSFWLPLSLVSYAKALLQQGIELQ